MDGAFQMFIGFGIPAGVVLTLAWFRLQERIRLLGVIETANQAERPLTPEMIRCLPGGFDRPTPERDWRRGIFLVAIGIGIFFIAIVGSSGLRAEDVDWAAGFGAIVAGIAAIPGCIGGAFMVLGRSSRHAD